MGLDFTWKGRQQEETARWAYSGFNRFRERLAESAGIDLKEMDGFAQGLLHEYIPGKSWKGVKDPIKYLLNHSDCDGQLSAKRCAVVSKRIRELVRNWEDGYDKQEALILAKNMDSCAAENTPLIFT